MIYWIILLIFGILYPISLKKNKLGNAFDFKIIGGRTIYALLASLALILFVGLRSTEVGIDTAMYKQIFDWTTEYSSIYEGYTSWKSGGVEPLFYFITYYFAKFFNFQTYLIALAVISISPVIYVIWKYSRNMCYSIFLYIAFGYLSFALSGLRQAAAIGICMLAFDAMIEKRGKKYVILIILAILFHRSAVLFIPVWWLNKIKKGRYAFLVFWVSLLSIFALRYSLFSFLNIFARQSYSIASTDQGGYRMFMVMLFTVIVGWIYYYRFIKLETGNSISWLLLLLVSISVLMWPVANLNAELNRMYYYYHIFIILYIPNLIQSIKGKEKIVIFLVFFLVGCYYLHSYIIGGQLKYYPYIPFWKLE